MLTVRSNESSLRSSRFEASPSWNRQVGEALGLGSAVPGLDEVARDVDAQHVGAEPGGRQRGGAVAAAEVEDLHAGRDPQVRRRAASPLSRMLAAMRVKSPFSHSALFGFIGSVPFPLDRSTRRVVDTPPQAGSGSLHNSENVQVPPDFFESWCASELAHAVQSSEVPGVAGFRVRHVGHRVSARCHVGRRPAGVAGCRLANGLQTAGSDSGRQVPESSVDATRRKASSGPLLAA